MIVTHQTILLWHEASDPPDADIEVLIAYRDEVTLGYYDDEEGVFANSFGRPIHDAICWAHVTTPEVQR